MDCQRNGLGDAKCTRTPLPQVGGRTYASLEMGDVHRCGHLAVGTLECWGANYEGAFGNGTEMNFSDTPVPAAGGMSFAKLISSRATVCGLTAGNVAYCWGSNGSGAVGDGSSTTTRPSPSQVAGNLVFADLMTGSASGNICGVANTGRAYCWGHGTFGQIGQGTMASSNVPVLVKLFP